MARLKVEYGIDLGTTNSSLARIENGASTILEIEGSKIVPSCVAYNRKGNDRVGLTAQNEQSNPAYQTHIEFKRRMGLDTLENSPQFTMPNGEGEELNPEILSAAILKFLKQRVNDEVFSAVAVTVPALFEPSQVEATKRAVKMAGFDQVEILMEPVAASFCYAAANPGQSGKWMVFDFGGGTFDSSIVEVDGGVMKVVSSEGDNMLGGKDLDNSIVEEILMPLLEKDYNISDLDEAKKGLLFKRIKKVADKLKIKLSYNTEDDFLSDLGQFGDDAEGKEIEIEKVFTREEFDKCYTPHIQKAIDLTKKLLKRNNLTIADIDTIILVGGPTQIPHFRTLISDQLKPPATDINPMTAVAEGAAIYASNIDNETPDHGNSLLDEADNDVGAAKVEIEVGFESSSADDTTPVSIVCRDKSKKLSAKLTRKDGWVSELSDLDAVFELNVIDGVNNFKIEVFDENNSPVKSNVSEININKGFSGGETSTQLHFGIGVLNPVKKRDVFTPLKGLEIDTPLPAVGLTKPGGDLYTRTQLRPGMAEDKMLVKLYNAESEASGHRISTTRYSGVDFSIDGSEVPKLIKEGAIVYFTLHVDRNQGLRLEIEFPESGVFLEKDTTCPPLKDVTNEEINDLLKLIDSVLDDAKNSNPAPRNVSEYTSERDKLKSKIDNGLTGDALKQTYSGLKQLLLNIDIAVDNLDWPKLEEEIYQALNTLEDLVRKCRDQNLQGHEQDQKDFENLKDKFNQVKETQNIELAQSLLDDVNGRDFRIRDRHAGKEIAIGYIRSMNSDYSSIDWTDSGQARMELDKGMSLIQSGASEGEIKQQLQKIGSLMKDPDFGGGDGGLRQ